MNVLFPVFALIALGYVLKRITSLGPDFWTNAERLTYYVFFPALLVSNLATANFSDYPILPMVGAIITGVVVVSGVVLFLRGRLGLTGPLFSSLFQGAIRPNLYMGIAASMALAGSQGVTLAAVAILAMAPLINFLAVPVVAHFGDSSENDGKLIVQELYRNPMILACLLGIGLNVGNIMIPAVVFEPVHMLGSAALPTGLLAVGAMLEFRHCLKRLPALSLAAVFKLALFPAVTAMACALYRVPEASSIVAVIFAALPCSLSSYFLARRLGGDEELMTAIVTTQTVLAVGTLPLITHLWG